MDAVIRAAALYLFLLVVFRVSGRRTLSQATTFDFVLLLIIGEATQQGLLGQDFSMTNAFIVIVTLMLMDIGMSLFQQRVPAVSRYVEGLPVVLLEHGEPIKDRMDKARVSESDLLEKARSSQGLERLEQIKYAVLEKDGSISIIPSSS
ncbi:MAG TPA: YetF domain-containing protein [Egibacteraceae bacterium]|nr:YetF domain-containing protein [Egibacteraceae bacterium]